MFLLFADTQWKCCVCLMETSKDWRVSAVMWITIGSSSKCLNRSDIDGKAMPLWQENWSWRKCWFKILSFPKVPHFLRKRVSPSPASPMCRAFSAWLEEQLRLKQTFLQIGSNKVKASPKNTFGLVPSASPSELIFHAGPPDLKKKKKCVNMSERAHFLIWKSNTNTCAAACWGSSRDPLKRSPQVIEKEQKE